MNDLAGNYDRIRELIARVIPGFEDFNARRAHARWLPAAERGARAHVLDDRRAREVHDRDAAGFCSLPPGRLRMMTLRSHDHTTRRSTASTIRYRGIRGERRVVMLNAADMVELGLVERQLVDLVSEWDDGERVAEKFIVVPFRAAAPMRRDVLPEANRWCA